LTDPSRKAPIPCFQRGFTADGSDLVNAVITAMTTSRPVHGAADAAARFPDVLPGGLRPLVVTVAALAVDGLRARASDDPDTYLPQLAMSLNDLANRLSEVGERQEALEVAREAVTHYRELAQASPGTYLPDLAVSLSNLTGFLSGVGERQEALEVAREAVTIRRELAQASPGTCHRPQR
jgi:tetratricopeptide (TPR) repeat protein